MAVPLSASDKEARERLEAGLDQIGRLLVDLVAAREGARS